MEKKNSNQGKKNHKILLVIKDYFINFTIILSNILL